MLRFLNPFFTYKFIQKLICAHVDEYPSSIDNDFFIEVECRKCGRTDFK